MEIKTPQHKKYIAFEGQLYIIIYIDLILNELIFENFYCFLLISFYFLLFAIFHFLFNLENSKKKLAKNNKNFQIKVHSKLFQ